MTVQRPIFCEKLQETLEGVRFAPFPGPLGERIYHHISEQAWKLWLAHQTMLINEHRLSLMEPKAQTFLMQEAEKFLFGDGSEKPAGYTAQ